MSLKKSLLIIALFLLIPAFAPAQDAAGKKAPQIAERNVRAHMEFLASDALQGRGSGTQFELLAGQYIASQMQQYGVEPAGQKDASGKTGYIQAVTINRNSFAEPPKLSFTAKDTPQVFEHGKQMLVLRMSGEQAAGPLQKITLDDTPRAGAVAFIKLRESDSAEKINQKLQTLLASGAAVIVIEETPRWRSQWDTITARKISFTKILNSSSAAVSNLIVVSKDAANALAELSDGAQVEIKGKLAAPETRYTWNAVGKITGSDPALSPEVILLSAHMDHLGVRPDAQGEDKIFNGADDDASGCVAVLELARVLGSGPAPKRSVYFAFFGSEEAGGYGAQYFVDNLPFAKDKLVANLEFEMIGRPDAKVAAEELWLTGYDRSNLGAELAKRGAKLVNDPHPEQNFFQRSDNYTLARQGIIAHTVSSYGLHTDYHKASDEVKTIDFSHMTRSINSMIEPVQWLVNSNFKPAWHEGKKP